MSLLSGLSWLCLAVLLGTAVTPRAQELNCQVQIQAPSLTNLDKSILSRLQQDAQRYLNSVRWTQDSWAPQERLQVTINMVITGTNATAERLEGSAQLLVRRPVHNASYITTTLNFQDRDLRFNYNPTLALEYSETAFVNQLTSLLNYYALMALGVDYDSFSPQGGTPYFQRALAVAQLAEGSGESGWRATDGRRTRYWLVENLLNNSYRPLRQASYTLHREVLDVMARNPTQARLACTQLLQSLKELFVANPDLYAMRVFLDSKGLELAQVMGGGTAQDQQALRSVMQVLDPNSMPLYEQALRGAAR